MGVEFYPCKSCGEVFCDAGEYAQCDCGCAFCSKKCGGVLRDKNGDWSCAFCRGESVGNFELVEHALVLLGMSWDQLKESYLKTLVKEKP